MCLSQRYLMSDALWVHRRPDKRDKDPNCWGKGKTTVPALTAFRGQKLK